ncbi:hypothetical protein H8A99_11660 [Bradyrhizobium sp. Arg68]|uniref:hypothetical protein n=1 Tax=Bradyrhizobium ivorense TaxID=2511166 RepID=UPI001E49D9CD|nr:hypothetical protein [Bradyrhizobium ivorense]MCC8937119.1 hypothetical protein [Bradyrhizobium ivorense]
MKRILILGCALIWAAGAGGAVAQIIGPGHSISDPPPIPRPPPPKVEVPPIPKLDALPTQRTVTTPRSSFGDRVNRCLNEAAAGGLNQADSASYSRSCAAARD